MPLKETIKSGAARISSGAIDLLAIGIGEGAAMAKGAVASNSFKATLTLLQEFHDSINLPQTLLPEIEKDITELKGNMEAAGFNNAAAVEAAALIITYRLGATPVLVQLARKNQENNNSAAAKRLLIIDKFWLAVQTFFLANAINTYFHQGGAKSEVEQGLVFVGAAVGFGGLLHLVGAAGARSLARKREATEGKKAVKKII
ncbi:MAG: hypothetical protein V1810_04120 [Candidatus Beckwithbacteria bacterium]